MASQIQQRRPLIAPAATRSIKCAEKEAVDQMFVKLIVDCWTEVSQRAESAGLRDLGQLKISPELHDSIKVTACALRFD